MSELEEVKKGPAALQEKVAKMKQAKNEPTEKWKPTRGEFYKLILPDGSINKTLHTEDYTDQGCIKFGNAFPLDMPLDNLLMIHQFINEMELICWQLGSTSSQDTVAYVIQSKCEIICYRFGSIIQRDNAYSMLSDKIKGWVEVKISSLV